MIAPTKRGFESLGCDLEVSFVRSAKGMQWVKHLDLTCVARGSTEYGGKLCT